MLNQPVLFFLFFGEAEKISEKNEPTVKCFFFH